MKLPMQPRSTSTAAGGRRLVLACCAILAVLPVASARAGSSSYAPDRVLVKYATATPARARAASARAAGAGEPLVTAPHTRLLRLARGVSVAAALRSLRRRPDVAWAVPDYRAHAAGGLIPDDVGSGRQPGEWQQLQWNFSGPFGVNAPQAWSNVAAAGAPGGKGVVVAVLDTGVAYATRGRFRRSPDFSRYGFTGGYDFIARNRFPNDRNGHGTFVAGTIAEATDNRYGLTGLAFAARIMPVRVLNSEGEGEASTIAEGVRFAVKHGARVINLSLEFSSKVTAADIPELLEALRFARRRGVLVVAAAGNEAHKAVAYPARAPYVVAVGATTEHGCLADYSNDGSGLTLVAAGGGGPPPPPRPPPTPARRPQLPSREPQRARRLPGHLHGRLPASLRHPGGLRRDLDGRAARRRRRGARDRRRRARPPSDAGADRRAAARHRAQARRWRRRSAVRRRTARCRRRDRPRRPRRRRPGRPRRLKTGRPRRVRRAATACARRASGVS
jgi:serine protease